MMMMIMIMLMVKKKRTEKLMPVKNLLGNKSAMYIMVTLY
jgi:hypothetical protein